MKPFDPTKPVQQRNGRPARILATDSKYRWINEEDSPIVAEYLEHDGRYWIGSFLADGKWPCGNPSYDLINIPETKKIKFWVNVYRDRTGHYTFGSSEDATRGCSINDPRFACICIEREVQEGEGL